METMSLAADRQIRSYNEKLLKKTITNEQNFNPVKEQSVLPKEKSESKEPKQQGK